MSFPALPANCVDALNAAAARGGLALDLGCGDGAFSCMLKRDGLRVVGLDSDPLARSAGAVHVAGDALRLPVREGSCDLVLAANLARHLLPRAGDWSFLDRWAAVLAVGGAVFVLEDAPGSDSPAVRNHRDLQAFLARLMPERRGPLVPAQELPDASPSSVWRCTARGTEDCDLPQDGTAAADLIAGDGRGDARTRRLEDSLRTHGLNVGAYWWARLEREPDHG